MQPFADDSVVVDDEQAQGRWVRHGFSEIRHRSPGRAVVTVRALMAVKRLSGRPTGRSDDS